MSCNRHASADIGTLSGEAQFTGAKGEVRGPEPRGVQTRGAFSPIRQHNNMAAPLGGRHHFSIRYAGETNRSQVEPCCF